MGGASGRERNGAQKKKGSVGGRRCTGEGKKSYAREQDLRELSSAERSGVILHNDG